MWWQLRRISTNLCNFFTIVTNRTKFLKDLTHQLLLHPKYVGYIPCENKKIQKLAQIAYLIRKTSRHTDAD